MPSLFFWKNWIKDYRIIWYLIASAFVMSVIFLWFSYFRGAEGVIDWQKFQEQKVIETTIHQFRLGPFEISIPGESYVILEYFQGSAVTPNTTASYFFLCVLSLGVIVILSVITTIDKFWFFVGMVLFIILIVSLRLEVLGIFGLHNKFPVAVALALFVIPAFYFNRIKTTVPFVTRLLVFSGVALAIGLLVKFASSVSEPFYHLTLTGYAAGLILSVLFIILIAHEILASFVYIVSQGSSKSLRHLSLICVIYMSNVVITCFHETGGIQWNFIYINLYLLLTLSAVLGIWGFRQRETAYGNILPFAPFGAYFFLSMGAICFATTGQLLGNANDPSLRVIRDAIIFSHTGYGIIFLTYIFSNFVLMLARDLPVYKVLYNPTRMPYFTYRFAGMIAMLGFVFYSGWSSYVFQSMSGFYNTAGDLYTLLGNDTYAESFYTQGQSQAFQNNRSNYVLASLKASRLSLDEAHHDYELANAKWPTVFSLANAGNVYIWEDNIPEAIRYYKEGLTRMPRSSILISNLGFAYVKTHQVDSALLYLDHARQQNMTKNSAETNFFALAALEDITLKVDSILSLFDASSTSVTANALALSTLQDQEFKTTLSPLAKRTLDLHAATLLNNYIIKYAKSLDTTFVQQANAIASDSVNSDYSEALKTALAFAFYHQGNVSKALEILAEQVYVTQSYKGKFNYIMGLWALDQGNPLLASSYFSFADTYDYKDARFYNAIALSEAGRTSDAYSAWDSVSRSAQAEQQVIAGHMKKILSLPAGEAAKLDDVEKYQFCRYRIGIRDSLLFDRIANTFENPNYKAQALLDISQKYYHAGQIAPAIRYYNRISGLELSDKNLFEAVRHFELLMLASRGEIKSLAIQINKGITFDTSQALEKSLYSALIAESSGDTVAARKHYNVLATYNPYLPEGIVAAASFFSRHDPGLKAYSILAEAIQINGNSIPLLRAYIGEALRVGFDEYAASATERLKGLEKTFP